MVSLKGRLRLCLLGLVAANGASTGPLYRFCNESGARDFGPKLFTWLAGGEHGDEFAGERSLICRADCRAHIAPVPVKSHISLFYW